MTNDRKHRACPNCGTSRFERIRRGFIKKYILRMKPIYKCIECEKSFSKNAMVYKSENTVAS